ncbi:universal stress protein [Nocardiopsis metallicus]|uniref:Nucleotide-binding universal stress UspA family protein n=1 Tax=Nocardiopsis metallicus TaxID=179819 RepID=A0A840WA86_9ACTN|nr:universal stress protein [Nocardiopsis metallicus]MBB5493919.1 nucleotide-binding universal stress UspA family protein [Nocardiopsis metallicus]
MTALALSPAPALFALAEAARGADRLVVGARGHHGFPRAALGAIAHGLLHSAPCPLMIVHSA